jgi:hypothetical protein
VSGRCLEADDYSLRLVPTGNGGYWVRRRMTGRTLGTVTKIRSKWHWEAWPAAYRGDGRKGRERDGQLSDVVPIDLKGSGAAYTQRDACEALIDHLKANQAPALGFGPHSRVKSRGEVGAR